MRTVSEILHFGSYYSSTKGKSLNQYISKGAASLIERCSKDMFSEGTILEHPNSLEKIYLNLLRQPPPINSETVIKST
jgi:hypothetical protein